MENKYRAPQPLFLITTPSFLLIKTLLTADDEYQNGQPQSKSDKPCPHITVYKDIHLWNIMQSCTTLCDAMDCSPPSSLVYGIFRQEYWSGLPIPSAGDLPDPGIEPVSSALAGGFFTPEPAGKPLWNTT